MYGTFKLAIAPRRRARPVYLEPVRPTPPAVVGRTLWMTVRPWAGGDPQLARQIRRSAAAYSGRISPGGTSIKTLVCWKQHSWMQARRYRRAAPPCREIGHTSAVSAALPAAVEFAPPPEPTCRPPSALYDGGADGENSGGDPSRAGREHRGPWDGRSAHGVRHAYRRLGRRRERPHGNLGCGRHLQGDERHRSHGVVRPP